MPIIIDDSAVSVAVGVGAAAVAATAPGYIPHFAYPFTFNHNADGSVSVATVEQDTLDEIVACVEAIVACPIGYRDELPPFGIKLPEFAQTPVDSGEVAQQVGRWEQRASLSESAYPDLSSDAWWHVRLDVSGGDLSEGTDTPVSIPVAPYPSSGLLPGPSTLP